MTIHMAVHSYIQKERINLQLLPIIKDSCHLITFQWGERFSSAHSFKWKRSLTTLPYGPYKVYLASIG